MSYSSSQDIQRYVRTELKGIKSHHQQALDKLEALIGQDDLQRMPYAHALAHELYTTLLHDDFEGKLSGTCASRFAALKERAFSALYI